MVGEHVLYDGRIIPKAGFRAYIYSYDAVEKLVNSWQEYESNIATGVWFSHKDKVPAKKPFDKGKK